MLMLLLKIAFPLIIVVPLTLISKLLEKPKPVAPPPKGSKKSPQLVRPPKGFKKIKPYIASYTALGIVAVASVLSTSGIDMINEILSTPKVEVKVDNKKKNTEFSVIAKSSKY